MGQRFGVRFALAQGSNENWMVAETAKKVIEGCLEKTGLNIKDCKSFTLTIQDQEADGEKNIPDAIIFEVRAETKDDVPVRDVIKPIFNEQGL